MSKYTEQKCFEIGLTDLCAILHGALAGTGDILSSQDEEAIRSYLRSRLNDWYDPIDKFSYYDRAIKQLIEIALLEPTLYQSDLNLTDKSLDQIITLSFYI